MGVVPIILIYDGPSNNRRSNGTLRDRAITRKIVCGPRRPSVDVSVASYDKEGSDGGSLELFGQLLPPTWAALPKTKWRGF